MSGVGIFFMATVIALVVEALLEYVFGIWWRPFSDDLRPKILMAFGLILGIVLCVFYQIDLLAEIGLPPSMLGRVLTGALVGRGADFLHQFWNRINTNIS